MFRNILRILLVLALVPVILTAQAPEARADDSFIIDGSDVLTGYTGSKAEKYAKTNGNLFQSLGVVESTAGEVEVFSDTSGIYISLSDETIELNGFTVAAYSLDGGNWWLAKQSDTSGAEVYSGGDNFGLMTHIWVLFCSRG